MKQRTGREVFLQNVARIYANKAPSFYFIDMSTEYDGCIGEIITDVMNEVTGNYRSIVGLLSTDFYGTIFGNDHWRSKGFRANIQPSDRHGPTPKDIVELIQQMDFRPTLPKDRQLLVYSTNNDAFRKPAGSGGFGASIIDYGAFRTVSKAGEDAKANIEQVQISIIPSYNTMEQLFSTDCSVIVSKLGGIPFITVLGSKDDDALVFAYRDGTYEPMSFSQLVQPYERIKCVRDSVEKRAYAFDRYNEYDINLLAAFRQDISETAYYAFPTYIEEFTLLDAVNTPLDELFKLAAGVENGLTVFCNGQTNPKSDDVVEEAGLAWREGKYVSLNDSIQPGFSRNGTFMYRSEKLKDLVVISYNLLLEKENS